VLALRPQRLARCPKALAAVRAFAALPESPALAAANKRVGNILKKAELEGPVDAHVNPACCRSRPSRTCIAALQRFVPEANAQFDAGDYTASLQTLAVLRAPVDAFFDDVMVNAEQLDLRLNRQGLLKTLHEAMNRVADLSRLAWLPPTSRGWGGACSTWCRSTPSTPRCTGSWRRWAGASTPSSLPAHRRRGMQLPQARWPGPAGADPLRALYEFRRGKRRTIGFSIGPDGLAVRAPAWVPLHEVDAALLEKAGWIVRKLGEARERQGRVESARIEWRDGAAIPYLGEPVRDWCWIRATASRRPVRSFTRMRRAGCCLSPCRMAPRHRRSATRCRPG
jgi:hypothetical protein